MLVIHRREIIQRALSLRLSLFMKRPRSLVKYKRYRVCPKCVSLYAIENIESVSDDRGWRRGARSLASTRYSPDFSEKRYYSSPPLQNIRNRQHSEWQVQCQPNVCPAW